MDWARDIFRPNILRQLRTLTAANFNDTMTFAFDPDVYSLQGEVQPWMEGQDIDPEELLDVPVMETVLEDTNENVSHFLDQFSSKDGIVKDARQIQSRLRGLIITRDNLETVLQSFENSNAATRFVRSVISLLSRRCVALDSEDVLDAVENHWTGHTCRRPNRFDQKPKVYAQFRISYYINPAWEQVRELTYLAATDDARELLIARAGIRGAVRRSQFSPPECGIAELLYALDNLRKKSVRCDLVTSLRRHTYMIDFEEPRTVLAIDDDGVVQEFKVSKAIIKQDTEKRSPGVLMQGTVHAVYEKYRVGSREPSEPFLRASTGVDSEGRILWEDWKQGDSLLSEHRQFDKILVYSDVPDGKYLPEGSRQKYCLYCLDGQTDRLNGFSVASKLIWTLFSDEIYITVRKAKVPRNSRNWQDNRAEHWFSMKPNETRDLFKISRNQFRQEISGWIKAAAGSEASDAADLTRVIKTWYLSNGAVSALHHWTEMNRVCTIYSDSG